MAGMLPGVEAARRRRVHQSSAGCATSSLGFWSSPSSTRFTFSPTFLLGQTRSRTSQNDENSKLGTLARLAKERLDEKLKAHRSLSSSLITMYSSDMGEENKKRAVNVAVDQLRREVFGSKKRLMGWAKLRWKSGQQQECAVCLEEFKVGDNLMNLPCAHRFHSACMLPWLHSNAHCPCCRISILS